MAGLKDFSFMQSTQTSSGTYLAFCLMGLGSSALGLKLQGFEPDHSPPALLHLVLGLKMHGGLPPILHVHSWCNA